MSNYLIKIETMRREGELPHSAGLHDIKICHDDWCKIFRGGNCNCDPEITIRENVTRQEMLSGLEESAKRFRETVRKKKL